MAENSVLTSIIDREIGLITINRPKRLNALNMDVKNRVQSAIEDFGSNASIKVIVITGSDIVFVAGTDLSEMVDMQTSDHARLGTNDMFLTMRACAKPLIASVEGYALGGGCETALNCDVIFASETAKFGQPEIRVGIMAGAGGTQYLSRTIGKYKAMKLLLTGDHFSAQDAYDFGMVSELTPEGEALDSAIKFAKKVMRGPQVGVQMTKAAVKHGDDYGITEGLRFEREAFEKLFETRDQEEGMRAFLEKRRPDFKDKP